jgi:uncharacterized protein Yka (UPF0111/DUF47 family)
MSDDTEFREQLLDLLHRHDVTADELDDLAESFQQMAENRRSDREVLL